MKHYLGTRYEKVIATKDYVLAVGDIPIGLVAHLDTVFKVLPENIYYDRVKNVMWSPDGLGADDRAGVYSIMQLIKGGLRPTVILTTDEELGCIGASCLVEDFKDAPTELKYIIELDRRGSNDCVFYDCDNPAFDDYVETFGFVTNFGSFSDISIICPAWKVAGVNLSIGYYDEHSISETLHIGQMYDTIRKVKRMLEDATNAKSFEYIARFAYGKWFKKYSAIDDEWAWDPSYGISKEDWMAFMEPQSKCHDCGVWDFDYNLFPTKGENGETFFFCSDCITKHPHVHWCSVCGEPFIDAALHKGAPHMCKDCRGNVNGKYSEPDSN